MDFNPLQWLRERCADLGICDAPPPPIPPPEVVDTSPQLRISVDELREECAQLTALADQDPVFENHPFVRFCSATPELLADVTDSTDIRFGISEENFLLGCRSNLSLLAQPSADGSALFYAERCAEVATDRLAMSSHQMLIGTNTVGSELDSLLGIIHPAAHLQQLASAALHPITPSLELASAALDSSEDGRIMGVTEDGTEFVSEGSVLVNFTDRDHIALDDHCEPFAQEMERALFNYCVNEEINAELYLDEPIEDPFEQFQSCMALVGGIHLAPPEHFADLLRTLPMLQNQRTHLRHIAIAAGVNPRRLPRWSAIVEIDAVYRECFYEPAERRAAELDQELGLE